jgi:hypothetical protein
MDPIQAANVVLTAWDLLRGVAGDTRDGDRPTPTVGNLPAIEREGPDSVARDYVAMNERMERLVLVTHAMWTLLSEKLGVTEADLVKRLTDLDAADGTGDGKVSVTTPPPRCSCGAAICRKMNRCLFCGKPYLGGSTFDTL